jgi:hypothetical protein
MHVSRPTGPAPINTALDDLNSVHTFSITTPTLYLGVQTTGLFLQKDYSIFTQSNWDTGLAISSATNLT